MRKVALGCLGGLLLGHALWASEDLEEKKERALYAYYSALESRIKTLPNNLSVVLGAPTRIWLSCEFLGDYLYVENPLGSLNLNPSWQDTRYLKPLVGKVDSLYLIPGHFKTRETNALDISTVLNLLDPWGRFYYMPAFVPAQTDGYGDLRRDFQDNRLPLKIKTSSQGKEKEFVPSMLDFLKRHFEEADYYERSDGQRNYYRMQFPLIHRDRRDPLSIWSVQKTFDRYFNSKNPENFLGRPSYPLVLGRLCEDKKATLREIIKDIGGTIFLHPQGESPLDVGYDNFSNWHTVQKEPFTLPLSWQDPALFKKLSPLEGKITHLFALPGRTACDELDLGKMDVERLMRLLTEDAVMLVEPIPLFVKAGQNATVESLNYLRGIPLSYAVPDVPDVSLTEKLRQTKVARTSFLRRKFYPHLCERLGGYFTKIEWLEVDEYDSEVRAWFSLPESFLGLRLTGVRQDF